MTTEPAASAHSTEHTNQPSVDIHLQSASVGDVTITFPRVGVTAIVGGNNVGKSTFLRELNVWLAREPGAPSSHHYVVEGANLQRSGSTDDLDVWLAQNASFVDTPQPGYVRLHANHPIRQDLASHYWRQESLGRLASFFVHYSVALSRGAMVEPVQQRPDIASPPQHPLHVLQDHAEVLEEVNEICQEIFRKPLTLDRLSGSSLLRVGEPEVNAPPVDAVTAEYRNALVTLPGLNNQGDGMRSLLGLLLPVITATYPIVLIDEPEAFLHPPQAYQLGKTLAKIARERRIQVILATHDRSLLAGLLAAETDVSVVRLDRDGDNARAFQLSAMEVKELWTDPVMRYSNVLEGLFHRVVIVAEADPDCRFFAASIDALDEDSPLSVPPSEILFVPSGGKDGMAKIVRALRAASVKVVACPDLDFLDDENTVRKLVEAFGGTWDDYKEEYKKSVHDLRAVPVDVSCAQVLTQIEVALKDRLDDAWTEEMKKLVRPAMRTSQSEFQKLKRFGMATFSGQAAVHASHLVERLDALGICCVREGELERLAPTVGVSKSAAWLPAALSMEAQRGEEAKKQARLILTASQIQTTLPSRSAPA